MFLRAARSAVTRSARFSSSADGVRRDLFGYEQSSDVAPWNAKISAVKNWNDAGELLVDMNRANCPPDLSSYTEVLRSILRCDSKYEGGVTEGESKFTAMMDVLEEMEHRNKIKVDSTCWNLVMEAALAAGDYRSARGVVACVNVDGKQVIEQKHIDAAEKMASDAVANKTEFPDHLTKQAESLFDIEIKAQ